MSITIIICEVETMKAPLVITMAREDRKSTRLNSSHAR